MDEESGGSGQVKSVMDATEVTNVVMGGARDGGNNVWKKISYSRS